jgi:iron complex transport system permease protein
VIGTLLGSVIALLKYLADPYNQLPAITYWLLGSLAAIARATSVPPPARARRSRADAAPALAHEPARASRRRGARARRRHPEAAHLVVAAATLMTAAAVAVSGIIGWVGL